MTNPNEANIATPVSEAVLQTPLKIAYSLRGMNRSKDRYQVTECTVAQLLNRFFMKHRQDNEKDGQHILQGSVVGPNRANAAVDAVYTLQLDLDCGDYFENVVKDIQDSGLFAVVYTTHSDQKAVTEISKDMLDKRADVANGEEATLEDALHYLQNDKRYRAHVLEGAEWGGVQHTPNGIKYIVNHKPMDKLRVLFVLDKPFVIMEHGGTTQASKEWASYRRGLEHKFDVVSDRATKDLSRLFYTPSHPAGAEGLIEIIDGKLLDLSTIKPIFDDKIVDPYAAAAAKMGTDSDTFQTDGIMKFFAQYGHRFEIKNFIEDCNPDGRREGRNWCCPFDDEHSDAGNDQDQGFFAVNASDNEGGQSLAKCMHDSCSNRDRVHFTDKLCINHGKTVEDLINGYVPLEEGETDTPKPRVNKRATANPDGINEDEGDVEDNESEEDAQTSDTLNPYKNLTDARKAVAAVEAGNLEAAGIIAKRLGMTASVEPTQRDVFKKELGKSTGLSPGTFMEMFRAGVKAAVEDQDGSFDEDNIRILKNKNKIWAKVRVGGKSRVMVQSKEAGEIIELMDKDSLAFETSHERMVVEDGSGNKKSVPIFSQWHKWEDVRRYSKIVFAPPGAPEPPKEHYNMWSGFSVTPKRGEWGILRQHMFENMCDRNQLYFDFLFMWLADLVQQPGNKKGSALVLKGKKGVGKSILFEVFMQKILGPHCIIVSHAEQITGGFNAHQKAAVLMCCEEAVWAANPQGTGILKHLITGKNIMITPKGVDSIQSPNHIHMVFLSNEEWVVPATWEDERRFFVLEVGDERQGDDAYFGAMTRQMMDEGGLEAMLFDLLHWNPPSTFENGWNALRHPPKTEALRDQARHSKTPHDRFAEFLADGLDLDSLKGEVVYSETPWDKSNGIGIPFNTRTASQVRLFDLTTEFTRWAKHEGVRYMDEKVANKKALSKALRTVCGSYTKEAGGNTYHVFPTAMEMKQNAAVWRGDAFEMTPREDAPKIDKRDAFK